MTLSLKCVSGRTMRRGAKGLNTEEDAAQKKMKYSQHETRGQKSKRSFRNCSDVFSISSSCGIQWHFWDCRGQTRLGPEKGQEAAESADNHPLSAALETFSHGAEDDRTAEISVEFIRRCGLICKNKRLCFSM